MLFRSAEGWEEQFDCLPKLAAEFKKEIEALLPGLKLSWTNISHGGLWCHGVRIEVSMSASKPRLVDAPS